MLMHPSRRTFLQSSAALAVGFTGLQRFVAGGEPTQQGRAAGFGPLVTDPQKILDLPKDFSYRIISRRGQTMADGLLVPDKADGMATFSTSDGLTIVVRNHEINPGHDGAFGPGAKLLSKVDRRKLYDAGRPELPCGGGTTTMVFDTRRQRLVRQFLSLAGTSRNCAGGPTPWNTWITCEEVDDRQGEAEFDGRRVVFQHDHGYNFEVPASATPSLAPAVPLKTMGRFIHEAVAVDPKTGVVYQTEDEDDGLIYRFLPNDPGRLSQGGRLQALVVADQPSVDLRNWNDEPTARVGDSHAVRWIDLDHVEAPDNDLRLRGFAAGAARFARGEGMWYSQSEIYFACTSGGSAKLGQIWKYTPSPAEGQQAESNDAGRLELFIEPNDSNLVVNADNLTAAPWGDLVVCEDRDGDEVRLIGVTPEGACYTLAHNHVNTEFAGATFSPDGTTLFVNLQHQGLTLAITGPWQNRA